MCFQSPGIWNVALITSVGIVREWLLFGILDMSQSVKRKHLSCLSCELVMITLCLIKYWYFPFSHFDLYQISWLVSWEPKGNSALQAFLKVINYVVTPFPLPSYVFWTRHMFWLEQLMTVPKMGGATATVHFSVHVLLFVISAMPKYTVHFYKGASQTSLTW